MGIEASGAQRTLQNMSNILKAASGAQAAFSSHNGGSAHNEYYKELAKDAELRAQREARKSREQAQKKHDKLRNKQRKSRSRGKTSWGRSGVKLGTGSPLAVLEGQAWEDSQDQMDILTAGERQAAGLLAAGDAKAAGYRNKSAKQNNRVDPFGAAESLLSLGGSIYDTF